LCFSFLSFYNPKEDFKHQNNEIIISALKNLDIDSVFSGRNDILVNEKKISGSAYKLNLGKNGKRGVSLHHGTILLNVDVSNMNRYLNPNKLKLISKGVDSVRSRVINLLEINPELTTQNIYNEVKFDFNSA
jgi:lipoate-protein ligase A